MAGPATPQDHRLEGFYPGQAPIDAVGGGGFRFADMGHRGSLLILPSGIRAWSPMDALTLGFDDFAAAMAERTSFDFLLLGTGDRHVTPPSALMTRLAAEICIEVMATRAACRTYNVLLNEGRSIAAGLIAC